MDGIAIGFSRRKDCQLSDGLGTASLRNEPPSDSVPSKSAGMSVAIDAAINRVSGAGKVKRSEFGLGPRQKIDVGIRSMCGRQRVRGARWRVLAAVHTVPKRELQDEMQNDATRRFGDARVENRAMTGNLAPHRG